MKQKVPQQEHDNKWDRIHSYKETSPWLYSSNDRPKGITPSNLIAQNHERRFQPSSITTNSKPKHFYMNLGNFSQEISKIELNLW